jgi:hypothetical protein
MIVLLEVRRNIAQAGMQRRQTVHPLPVVSRNLRRVRDGIIGIVINVVAARDQECRPQFLDGILNPEAVFAILPRINLTAGESELHTG